MLHDSTELRREQLAIALAEAGFAYTASYLRTLGSRGPPAARRQGQAPLFRWDAAIAWAKHRAANRRRAGRPKGGANDRRCRRESGAVT
jgi:hypothetical protein